MFIIANVYIFLKCMYFGGGIFFSVFSVNGIGRVPVVDWRLDQLPSAGHIGKLALKTAGSAGRVYVYRW